MGEYQNYYSESPKTNIHTYWSISFALTCKFEVTVDAWETDEHGVWYRRGTEENLARGSREEEVIKRDVYYFSVLNGF